MDSSTWIRHFPLLLLQTLFIFSQSQCIPVLSLSLTRKEDHTQHHQKSDTTLHTARYNLRRLIQPFTFPTSYSMPELPEVEVILSHLKGTVLGGSIQTFTIHRSDIVRTGHNLIPWFRGSTITNITRKGKCVIFTCHRSNEARYLLSELGMTGLWFFHHTLASSPQHLHCHIGLSGAQATELYYWNPRRFGRLWLFALPELEAFLERRFGSDALDIGEQSFIQLIQSCRGRLKPFFLDQHRLAGIGNIYANEILFRARIHPQAHGYRLGAPSCQRLYHTMHTVLQEAIAAGGSSIRDFRAPDGSQGHFQKLHQVYQKAGLPCSHGCPTLIKRMPSERSSFYCSACQKRR